MKTTARILPILLGIQLVLTGVIYAQPANNTCATAVLLSTSTTCSNVTGTVANATSDGNSSCSGTVRGDVWYKFVAASTSPTITLSGVGANFANPKTEIFSWTACPIVMANSLACGTTTLTASGLTIGTTYYVRVYSTAATIPTTNAGFSICITNPAPRSSSRTNEVFKQTTLSGSNILNDPWEVAYGPDDFLWVTEAKGYKVYRINPTSGVKTTVLDISNGATGFLTAGQHTTFNCGFTTAQNPWPQGGLAGLAIHPQFNSGKPYVYISYVRQYNSTAASNGGVFFTNYLVRFNYNSGTGKLDNPIAICDTLPGSSDHNSQRIGIAPVGGVDYLFYAQGDMGAGQFANSNRPMKAQITASYEGKILRFNLEPDADAGAYDRWIPNTNPFNGAAQSAVWATGIRNNQGFAKANINGTDLLFGASHGPYSDDEINIIESAKNYGHPLVIGYNDGNYNGSAAGTSGGSCPVIPNENTAVNNIGVANYKDPLFSAYAAPAGNTTTPNTIQYIWTTNPPNGGWPSEGWSGMDIYTNNKIPGWKNSLLVGSLKWGRVLRFKLGSTGTTIATIGGQDTLSYFGSTNRFRDVALDPNGRDLYVIMDKSSTTSGPSAANPSVPACAGCLQKYTFLGYNADGANKSLIPNFIPIAAGTANNCVAGNTITIDATNNNIWVPITDSEGDIIAEIKANGNNLGNVTSSFYKNSGALREDPARRVFLDRSFTITPTVQPASAVDIRLYISTAEFNSMVGAFSTGGVPTGVNTPGDLRIFKNSDPCSTPFSTGGSWIAPVYAEAFGTGGYVIQASTTSFSSFYFASQTMMMLPAEMLSFTAQMQNSVTNLKWETANEKNTSHFVIERSVNSHDYEKIGTVDAAGNSTNTSTYYFTDNEACAQSASLIYYRLKIVDMDGSVNYSKVVTVKCNSDYSVTVYPNPVSNVMKIRVSLVKPENIRIQVSDMQGRIVYTQTNFVQAGTKDMQINTEAWSAQMYSVKITGSDDRVLAVKNIVKQ